MAQPLTTTPHGGSIPPSWLGHGGPPGAVLNCSSCRFLVSWNGQPVNASQPVCPLDSQPRAGLNGINPIRQNVAQYQWKRGHGTYVLLYTVQCATWVLVMSHFFSSRDPIDHALSAGQVRSQQGGDPMTPTGRRCFRTA